jgi:hypothetical protein
MIGGILKSFKFMNQPRRRLSDYLSDATIWLRFLWILLSSILLIVLHLYRSKVGDWLWVHTVGHRPNIHLFVIFISVFCMIVCVLLVEFQILSAYRSSMLIMASILTGAAVLLSFIFYFTDGTDTAKESVVMDFTMGLTKHPDSLTWFSDHILQGSPYAKDYTTAYIRDRTQTPAQVIAACSLIWGLVTILEMSLLFRGRTLGHWLHGSGTYYPP